jgi:hypothetical protein
MSLQRIAFPQISRLTYKAPGGWLFSRASVSLLMVLFSSLLTLLTAPAIAQKSLPTPGSTWGEIHFPGSALPEDSDNLILEGAVLQGVDFLPITENTVLDFFGSLDYSLDTEGFDWYRRLELGIGFKLRHYLSDTAIIAAGIKYEVEKYFVDERTAQGFQLFSNWFNSWQLPGSDQRSADTLSPLGFPGITWGEIRYPGTQLPLDESNLILDGYVEQGVDWMDWGKWGTFNFYANLDFITDTEDLAWNNSIAYGAGVKLKKLIGDNVLLQYGIEAVHERRWINDQNNDVIFVYLNWSGWWDPRAIRLDLPE